MKVTDVYLDQYIQVRKPGRSETTQTVRAGATLQLTRVPDGIMLTIGDDVGQVIPWSRIRYYNVTLSAADKKAIK